MIPEDSEEEEEDNDGTGGDGGDGDDDMDNIPLNVCLQTMSAQTPPPAGGPVAGDFPIVDVPDSSEGTRGADLVQPRAEPVPYSLPEPESSAVIGGMFMPDEPSIVDLGGDPNTVSTESSFSFEESENIILYSIDRDPSPSRAATSEIREPPPPADSRKSVGQDNITGEPVTAAAAQHLREEEEDDIQDLPHLAAGGPFAGQHGAVSTSTPSGSHQ